MNGFVHDQLLANSYIDLPYSTVIAYIEYNEVNPNVTFKIGAGQLPGGILLMKRLVNTKERQAYYLCDK